MRRSGVRHSPTRTANTTGNGTPRAQGCAGAVLGMSNCARQIQQETVHRGRRDAQERCSASPTRTANTTGNGTPRAQGCAGAVFGISIEHGKYNRKRYTAGAGMRRSGVRHLNRARQIQQKTVHRGRRDAHDCRDAGGRAPKVGAPGDAGAVAEERRVSVVHSLRDMRRDCVRFPHRIEDERYIAKEHSVSLSVWSPRWCGLLFQDMP